MRAYLVRRCLQSLVVFAAILVIVFFMLGVLAVGFGAVTLALIVNQTIDRTTDYRHRRRLVHRFSPVVSLRNAGGGIHRCAECCAASCLHDRIA